MDLPGRCSQLRRSPSKNFGTPKNFGSPVIIRNWVTSKIPYKEALPDKCSDDRRNVNKIRYSLKKLERTENPDWAGTIVQIFWPLRNPLQKIRRYRKKNDPQERSGFLKRLSWYYTAKNPGQANIQGVEIHLVNSKIMGRSWTCQYWQETNGRSIRLTDLPQEGSHWQANDSICRPYERRVNRG